MSSINFFYILKFILNPSFISFISLKAYLELKSIPLLRSNIVFYEFISTIDDFILFVAPILCVLFS
jgi:hypothetical protein